MAHCSQRHVTVAQAIPAGLHVGTEKSGVALGGSSDFLLWSPFGGQQQASYRARCVKYGDQQPLRIRGLHRKISPFMFYKMTQYNDS